jgi:hypothetical protein
MVFGGGFRNRRRLTACQATALFSAASFVFGGVLFYCVGYKPPFTVFRRL